VSAPSNLKINLFEALIRGTYNHKEFSSMHSSIRTPRCRTCVHLADFEETPLGQLQVFHAGTGKAVAELVGHKGTVRAMLFLRETETLVTSSFDKTIRTFRHPEAQKMIC
jgi:hypothetical protein